MQVLYKGYVGVYINLLPSLEADTCNELWEASSFFGRKKRSFHILALQKVLKATQQFSND